jgi:predicted flap endonuclease-1-like 5' DNA nuclease
VRDEQIAKLRKELDGWQERVPPLVERFRVRNEEAQALQQDLLAARQRIADLEAMLGSDETRVEPVDPEALGDDLEASNDPDEPDDTHAAAYATTAESADDLAEDSAEDSADNLDNEVGELLEDLEELEDYVASSAADARTRDDLMQIKGVGPAIAKTLHELGIFHFEQIAAMSEYDIDRVAQRLKGFRSRIYREDWIGQARALLDEKQSGSA